MCGISWVLSLTACSCCRGRPLWQRSVELFLTLVLLTVLCLLLSRVQQAAACCVTLLVHHEWAVHAWTGFVSQQTEASHCDSCCAWGVVCPRLMRMHTLHGIFDMLSLLFTMLPACQCRRGVPFCIHQVAKCQDAGAC